jgi:hypothetical protein
MSNFTIPCLSPDEQVCAICGRHAPMDEIQWDVYNGPGSPMVCINCDSDDLEDLDA